VEAGAVLSSIAAAPRCEGFSAEFAALAGEACGTVAGKALAARIEESPLADSVVLLDRNYRFPADSGIGALSAAVRQGDRAAALSVIDKGNYEDCVLLPSASRQALVEMLGKCAEEHFSRYAATEDPADALALLDRLCILCALRTGPFGSTRVNSLVESMLRALGNIDPRSRWYHGRPVMVTRNSYDTGLFNGDTGMVLRDSSRGNRLRAFFPAVDSGVRSIAPEQLPEHETVYAMTVHKSQGSEFDRVILVHPDTQSPVLTRELVYTAITRARQKVEILSGREILERAIGQPTRRWSGLGERLWGR
jgi:exodeoxyribonuclease V alpha subunit